MVEIAWKPFSLVTMRLNIVHMADATVHEGLWDDSGVDVTCKQHALFGLSKNTPANELLQRFHAKKNTSQYALTPASDPAPMRTPWGSQMLTIQVGLPPILGGNKLRSGSSFRDRGSLPAYLALSIKGAGESNCAYMS